MDRLRTAASKSREADTPWDGAAPASGGASVSGDTPVSQALLSAPQPASGSDRPEPPPEDERFGLWLERCWNELQSPEAAGFLASFVLHALVAAILMLLMLVKDVPVPGVQLTSRLESPEPLDWAAEVTTPGPTTPQPVQPTPVPVTVPEVAPPSVQAVNPQTRSTPLVQEIGTWLAHAGQLEWDLPRESHDNSALQGRLAGSREGVALQRGGTRQSEAAVERGLRWIVAHQLPSGGWSFDHRKICQGQCRDPGTSTSTTAATGMALLALLGAGYTHQAGEYQDNIHRALYYLAGRGRATEHGRDYLEGDKAMYGQGLASMALCEAYAMTEDPGIREVAQQAIRFVIDAQDPTSGGWRYVPKEAGDMTVTGWQLMALKSAQMARFDVPSSTYFMACRFLDRVQSHEGACYGYISPENDPRHSTTAIGLLCRMYTGWPRDNRALGQGVGFLAQWGPAKDDMYYNYYATQVLHHYEGPAWDAWNRRMRDFLIATQATDGHEAGSWFFSGNYGKVGGRLYNTAMAVMTLEVYYRYLPLYSQRSVNIGF